MSFGAHVLTLDAAAETERITYMLRTTVRRDMHRRGAVVGISGGIDSSVVLALCVRAFGAQGVTALILPEQDSDGESETLARTLTEQFGITPIVENITPALAGLGCYKRRNEAIRRIFPEYDAHAGYKAKIVLTNNLLEADTFNVFSLTIITPDGENKTHRLPLFEYLQIVAASNFKQRVRMSMLYYHAELRNYAVIGTPNKHEREQGFFVKHGDGAADMMPIAHLYKTQVYQLAEYLDVPEEIRARQPTTDTYSARQSQEEFFFRIPFQMMDLLWYAQEHDIPISEVSQASRLTEAQIQRIYADFRRKQQTTEYLRMAAISLDAKPVEETNSLLAKEAL
jgi:NAD+ synthase